MQQQRKLTFSPEPQQPESDSSKIATIIFLTIAGGLFITQTFYLGLFSMANPDPDSCWVTNDVDAAARTEQEILAKSEDRNATPREGFPLEMH